MENIYEQLEISEQGRHISIPKEVGEFIFDFLKDKPISQTLETGFAYGCSAAFIISATKKNHIVIDPYEKQCFNDLGLRNIKKLGLEKFLRFIKLPSQIALPNLLNENIKIDFGLIDGNHKFDNIFIDWFYIDLLLNNNGYVLFDDTWLGSTQKTMSFIKNNREDYQEIAVPPTNMCMFQKIGKDNRIWSYFKPF
jgi:predicted O-methyltransferase YrrM